MSKPLETTRNYSKNTTYGAKSESADQVGLVAQERVMTLPTLLLGPTRIIGKWHQFLWFADNYCGWEPRHGRHSRKVAAWKLRIGTITSRTFREEDQLPGD